MTREQIETLRKGSIIECDYGLMMIAYFEDVERSDLKEMETDNDFVRLVRVEGVHEEDGEYIINEYDDDVYDIDDFLGDGFKLVK